LLSPDQKTALVIRIADRVLTRVPKCRQLLLFLAAKPDVEKSATEDLAKEFYGINSPNIHPESAFNGIKSETKRRLSQYFLTDAGRAEPVRIEIDSHNRVLFLPVTEAASDDLGIRLLRSLHGGRADLVVAYTDIVFYYNQETRVLRDGAGQLHALPGEVEQRYAVGRSDIESVALLWDLFHQNPGRPIPHRLLRTTLNSLQEVLTHGSVILLGSPFQRTGLEDLLNEPIWEKPHLYKFRVQPEATRIELVATIGGSEIAVDSIAMFGLEPGGKELAIVRRARTVYGTDLLLLAGTDTTSTLAVVEMFFRTHPLSALKEILGPDLDPDRPFERALVIRGDRNRSFVWEVKKTPSDAPPGAPDPADSG
jgi:hypothetical protein